MSNLDNIYDNGTHDYLKWIKFGYGRCTDHASLDTPVGLLGRGQAIDRAKTYNFSYPSNIHRWLEYTGMRKEHFDAIYDTFRDPKVWSKENGEWMKDDLWSNREFVRGLTD